MRTCLEAHVLGPFEATIGGRRLERPDWQRQSAELLVKLLLVTPGHRIGRDVAQETLWPDAEPDTSRASLRKALHYARQALGGDGLLVSSGGAIWLDPDAVQLDLDRLNDAFERIKFGHANAPEIDDAVRTILSLGARELLPDDPYEDWLVAPRERLRTRWHLVALRAAHAAKEAGRTAEAHDIVEQLLAFDPTDESACRLSMELYSVEGRHHAVRRAFLACRDALSEELGVEPSAETVALFDTLSGRTSKAIPVVPRLVGRRSELERVEKLFDRVAGGRLGCLSIRGPAGIGKSRLLDEVVAYARAAGWRILAWQSVEASQCLDYGPLRVALEGAIGESELESWTEPARSAIATLVPGLAPTHVIRFEERAGFVAGLLAAITAIARPAPLVIAIDDVVWLDPSTVVLLSAIIANLGSQKILVALTRRDEEPVREDVGQLLDQSHRGGLEILLGPLGQRELDQLLLSRSGGESVDPPLSRLLYERSLGNPLFCLETVALAREGGSVVSEGGRWRLLAPGADWELPSTVRQVVNRRSGRLQGPVRELLAVAAELDQPIEFDLLAAVLPDLAGGVIQALDAALASGLLVERAAGYAFAHPLYRLAVQGAHGARQRGEWHLAIALALAGLGSGEVAPSELERVAAGTADPAAVAQHLFEALNLGVAAALPMAVAFGFAAGARSLALFNRDVAKGFLERGLNAHARLPVGQAAAFDATAALVHLADIHMAADHDAAAIESYRAAVRAARTTEELVRAYSAYSWLPYRHGEFESAIAILEEGLARLPVDATAARARLASERAWCLVRQDRLAEALPVFEDAACKLEASPVRLDAMRAFDWLGDLLGMLGRTEDAIARLQQSLAIAIETGDARGETLARLHLAGTLTEAGRPASAQFHAARSLELAALMGDRYVESVASWMAASMEDALGDLSRARDLRLHELDLLRAVGGNPRNEALARAHLSNIAFRQGDGQTAVGEGNRARSLAAQCGDPAYAAAIERSLQARPWRLRPA